MQNPLEMDKRRLLPMRRLPVQKSIFASSFHLGFFGMRLEGVSRLMLKRPGAGGVVNTLRGHRCLGKMLVRSVSVAHDMSGLGSARSVR
jgi:hypothetical protein